MARTVSGNNFFIEHTTKMKQDILEQIAENWLLKKEATFTKCNVRYKPSVEQLQLIDKSKRNLYSVTSDIDLLAVHIDKQDEERVSAISCKSWQSGFHVSGFYHLLTNPEKDTKNHWKRFRELVDPLWAKAFRDKIYAETLSRNFTYYIVVTKLIHRQDEEAFINCSNFISNLSDNNVNKVKIKFLTLEQMILDLTSAKYSTTLEATELGRMIQLIRAAGLSINKIDDKQVQKNSSR